MDEEGVLMSEAVIETIESKKQRLLKHKNVRRLAWISFWSAIAYVALMAFYPEQMKDGFTAWLAFCGVNIGYYVSSTTARDGWGKN